MMRKSTRKWRKNADTITILAAGLIKQSYSTIGTCLDRNDTYLQNLLVNTVESLLWGIDVHGFRGSPLPTNLRLHERLTK